MRKLLLALTLLMFSAGSYAALYLGGNYGQDMFTSDSLKQYKVFPKGSTYGGFLGFGRDFVGVEGFYQSLNGQGDIKHDGETYAIKTNAAAIGAALRFSFNFFYFRLGLASYTLDQSIDMPVGNSQAAAEKIYGIEKKGTVKNGILYGMGLHHGFSSFRVFIDFSRYQINSIGNYDAYSVGVSFNIPEGWFSTGKY